VRLSRTPQWLEDYKALLAQDRKRVDAPLAKLLENPSLPGLRFGRLRGQKDPEGRDIWYFRASDSLRITCVRDRDVILLRRVGPHDIERTP
jgi:hypothetical protein